MTNDTTTLNGALTELGELLADNLVTMGVTDATASDGLSTLANKVLDIQGGSTPKLVLVKENKSIISYATSETLKLSAILFGDNVANQTVTFYANNTRLGTATTDSNGVAVYIYTSSKTNETTFYATTNNLTSNTVSVEDVWYWNDGTDINGVSITNGVTCTIVDGALRITTNTSGEKHVIYPPRFSNSDNFLIEFEVACTGSAQRTAFFVHNSTTATGFWCGYEISNSTFGGAITGSSFSKSTPLNVGDKVYIKRENGVISAYTDDTTIYSKTVNFSSTTYQFGNYTNNGRVQCIKNIKIKSL